MILRIYKKVSRNAMCPCGSGLKVKHCECDGAKAKDDYVDAKTADVIRDGEVIHNLRKEGE